MVASALVDAPRVQTAHVVCKFPIPTLRIPTLHTNRTAIARVIPSYPAALGTGITDRRPLMIIHDQDRVVDT